MTRCWPKARGSSTRLVGAGASRHRGWRLSAAIKDLSEALALRPERGDAWLLRGTAYRR